MSPRAFIAAVGAVIFIACCWVHQAYTPTANGFTCGTMNHGGSSEEAYHADMSSRMNPYSSYDYKGPNYYLNQCREKADSLKLPVYGGMAVGLLALVGAAVVRPKKSTTG